MGAIHFEDAYELYRTDAAIEWRDRALTRGWTAPTWPTEYGGGLDAAHQKYSRKKWLASRRCLPQLAWVWMIGPTILELGTEEQRQRHIPKTFRRSAMVSGLFRTRCRSDLAGLD